MMHLLSLATVLGVALATPVAQPLEVISSRSLLSRGDGYGKGKDGNCPVNGTLPESGFLEPTLMVPISAKNPDHAYGGTKVPIVTPDDFCTIFNLEIPNSAVGKTCTLEFLLPDFPSQTHYPFLYKGDGHFTFTGYAFYSGATEETTFNNPPPAGPSPPQPPAVLKPGNAYTINVGDCGIQPQDAKMTVSGALCSKDTTLVYYQNAETCPIGFFVTIS